MVYENLIPLFNSGQWTLHANATSSADGKTLTLNATAGFQQSYVTFAVTPNTLFDLAFTASGFVGVYGMDGGNAIAIMNYSAVAGGQRRFTSGRFTSIRIYLSNESAGAGTFTFSNLSLTRVQPGDPYASKVPAHNQSGWVEQSGIGNWSVSSDGTLCTFTATQAYQARYYQAAVAPNALVELEFTGTGKVSVFDSTGAVQLLVYKTAGKYQFNTGRFTAVRVYLSNADLGNGTFTWGLVTLRKVQPGDPYRNLIPPFSDAAWSRHQNTSVSGDGKTLTLNATAGSQTSSVAVTVPPNAVFQLGAVCTGGGYTQYRWKYTNGLFSSYLAGTTEAAPTKVITTPPNVAQVEVYCVNPSGGTFTFSNLELRRVQPGDPFAEKVTNGDFSNGSAGWSLSDGGSVVNGQGQITGNAQAYAQNLLQRVTVTPLTQYVANATITGAGGELHIRFYATVGGQYLGYAIVNAVNKVVTTPTGATVAELCCLRNTTAAGTAYFDSVSLRRVQPGDPYRELVVNGGFDQGATGWTINNSVVSNGRLVHTATAPTQYNYQGLNVTPNTSCVLTGTMSAIGGNALLTVSEWIAAGNTLLKTTTLLVSPSEGEVAKAVSFVTTPRTGHVTVNLYSSSAGTYTYDNISLKRKYP